VQAALDSVPALPMFPVEPVLPLLPVDPVLPILPLLPVDPVLPILPLLSMDPILPLFPVDPVLPVLPEPLMGLPLERKVPPPGWALPSGVSLGTSSNNTSWQTLHTHFFTPSLFVLACILLIIL